MRKSDFEALALILFLLFKANAVVQAKTLRTVTQTKYLDKYYQVEQIGASQSHIYLNGDRLVSIDQVGNMLFPLSDHLGSPTIMTNQQGQALSFNDYQAFGQLIPSTSSPADNYKFTGKEFDQENNLEYFGARYYSPVLSRFISIDPLLLKNPGKFLDKVQELNSYAYAKNNPVQFIDTDGLLTKVYLEKNQQSGWFEPKYDHTFMAINGLVYNWESNVGRQYHQQDGNWRGEDMDIDLWVNFMNRFENKSAEYDIYTLDTSLKQEREMRRHWLGLAENNSAEQGDLRTIYNEFLQSTDAVLGALKKGGVVNKNFSIGRSTANSEKLGYELWFKYKLEQENNQAKNQYYNNIHHNKFLAPVIDLFTYQYQDYE